MPVPLGVNLPPVGWGQLNRAVLEIAQIGCPMEDDAPADAAGAVRVLNGEREALVVPIHSYVHLSRLILSITIAFPRQEVGEDFIKVVKKAVF